MRKRILILAFILTALFGGFVFFNREEEPVLVSTAVHGSYFSQKGFYEDAYKLAPNIYNPEAKAILVNHHLLAANFIAEAFNTVATDAPITVLLISPNHFSAGRNSVITSAAVWETPYGKLEPDLQIIRSLKSKRLASVEEDPFEQEHGISGIVGFIKKSLPNAKLVPLILKDRISPEQAIDIANNFSKTLPQDSLVVGSLDFSHYLTDRAAQFHDLESLNVLQTFDFESIYNLDIDSRPGLTFLLQILKKRGQRNFSLLRTSNSEKLTHQDILETTSYITGYFSRGEPNSKQVSTMLSLGNIQPSDSLLPKLNRYSGSFGFKFIERLLYGQDKTYAFLLERNSTTETQLKKFGIELLSTNYQDHKLGNLKVKIISGSHIPKEAIDSGADIVIYQGASKNILEFYKNKPIIYAIGDFLNERSIIEGKNSLAIGLAAQDNTLNIYFLPIGVKNGELMLLIGVLDGTVLIEMAQNSPVDSGLKDQIKKGVLTLTIK